MNIACGETCTGALLHIYIHQSDLMHDRAISTPPFCEPMTGLVSQFPGVQEETLNYSFIFQTFRMFQNLCSKFTNNLI